MRERRPDLYDANVNGWLEEEGRKFLLRAFRGDNPGDQGIARAFLSDSYKMIDNLDVLTAALSGVQQTGADIRIDGCDLTDRRMYVKVFAPEIQALAPVLLENYRNPWGTDDARWREHAGYAQGEEPVVWAGFVISNSETGGGAFTVVPRLIIRICKNGLTITEDALRAVHLGGKMEEGIIRWSDDTQEKNVALITAKTRDAVKTFLDVEYMTKVITRVEEKSTVEVADPTEAIQVVGKKLAFSQDTIKGVLDAFIRGGDVTAGGVMNAVTAYAQKVEDADDAFALEAAGLQALELAASL
jgi:hypothetical protein